MKRIDECADEWVKERLMEVNGINIDSAGSVREQSSQRTFTPVSAHDRWRERRTDKQGDRMSCFHKVCISVSRHISLKSKYGLVSAVRLTDLNKILCPQCPLATISGVLAKQKRCPCIQIRDVHFLGNPVKLVYIKIKHKKIQFNSINTLKF